MSKADPGPAHLERAPRFEKKGVVFLNFNSVIRINLIVVNMHCLQYVLYSLFSLREGMVYVKGHQNNRQIPKILPRRDRAPILKFLDPPLHVSDSFTLT